MKKVDKTLNIPLYLQLSQIIQDMIESGELTEGCYLMPEREICKIQDISRMTVNKAIINLVNEGILTRQQGRGTFVAKKRQKSRYQNVEGLSEIMTKKGSKVKNNLLTFEVGPLEPYIQQKLETESESGYKIERVRYLDEEPVILETIYLDSKMCPDLNQDLVEQRSMYEMYHKKYNHELIRAEQIIKPIMLTKEQAKLLGQPVNTLALQINRVVYTTKEEVMEYTSSIFLTQKHDFEVVLNQQ